MLISLTLTHLKLPEKKNVGAKIVLLTYILLWTRFREYVYTWKVIPSGFLKQNIAAKIPKIVSLHVMFWNYWIDFYTQFGPPKLNFHLHEGTILPFIVFYTYFIVFIEYVNNLANSIVPNFVRKTCSKTRIAASLCKFICNLARQNLLWSPLRPYLVKYWKCFCNFANFVKKHQAKFRNCTKYSKFLQTLSVFFANFES